MDNKMIELMIDLTADLGNNKFFIEDSTYLSL